ncbi:hypothetical protein [Archangium lansingense]|uniref:Uncharacterized protein n=1 Tax=Archangium lansingense TaxID=2995310 RepID=A0ABT3ZVZ6_9BACT|nr:hypothetical protein [Archangium lansinium]MCY1073574.1 hypothetical protein [Archangium lansinium]
MTSTPRGLGQPRYSNRTNLDYHLASAFLTGTLLFSIGMGAVRPESFASVGLGVDNAR